MTHLPPDIAVLTLEQWRLRWFLSRRETAQAFGLTEEWIKRHDLSLLSNPTIERTGLLTLEQDFCWEATRTDCPAPQFWPEIRGEAAQIVLKRRALARNG